MKLLRPPMMPKMVIMKDIVTETYQKPFWQKDTHLIDKMVMLTNMIAMNMKMESHHRVKGLNGSLVKN